MESQEKIDAAKKAVYLTKEQREKQTQDFLAKIDAQRKNGDFAPKPTLNDFKGNLNDVK
jgi:hypothetical protein